MSPPSADPAFDPATRPAGAQGGSLATATLAVAAAAVPLAAVVRGALVESVHHGHVVVTDPAGQVSAAAGDPHVLIWPRSSLKPLQAVSMLQAGLPLDPADPAQGALLAVVAASHSGQDRHLDAVRALLGSVGLDEGALRNTPDLPLDAEAALRWRASGRGPSSLTQNCSGKHAGMIATAMRAGWDVEGYLEASHPLQRQVRDTVADLTGARVVHTSVDGCGAPLVSTTLAGLARAFGAIAAAAHAAPTSPEGRVARAMREHPLMVGGDGRDVSLLMAGTDGRYGLVAKDGAEGVYAAGLADGRGVALKVLDGGGRARPVILAGVLRSLGVDGEGVEAASRAPVLGHGRPVGAVVALPEQLTQVDGAERAGA